MNFSLVYEGKINSPRGVFFFWNPKLNLILVFTSSEDYFISRPKFKCQLMRLRSLKQIDGFCWGSFGKTWVITNMNNELLIHDVEKNGEIIHEKKFDTRIRCMQWFHNKDLQPFYPEKIKTYLLKIYKLPSIENLNEKKKEDRNVLLKKRNGINLLLVCTEDLLNIYFFGLLEICSVELKKIVQEKRFLIQSGHVSNDLKVLTLMYFSQTEKNMKMSTVNIDVLKKNKNQLHFISMQYTNLVDVIEKIKEVVDAMKGVWDKFYIDEFEKKFVNYLENELRNDGNVEDDFKSYFIQFLLYGILDEPFIRLLTQSVTDRLLVSVIKHFKKMKRIITVYMLRYLQNYIQHCIFRLSEVKGSVLWKEQFGIFGIDEKEISKLIEQFQFMHKCTNEIMKNLKEFSKSFVCFAEYLRYVHHFEIKKLNNEKAKELDNPLSNDIDIEDIKDFLNCYNNKLDFDQLFVIQENIVSGLYNSFSPISKNISKSLKLVKTVALHRPGTERPFNDTIVKSFYHFQYFGFPIKPCTIIVLRNNTNTLGRFEYAIFTFNYLLKSFKFYKDKYLICLLYEERNKDNGVGMFDMTEYPFCEYSNQYLEDLLKTSTKYNIESNQFYKFQKCSFKKTDILAVGDNGYFSAYANHTNDVMVFNLEENLEEEEEEGEDEKMYEDYDDFEEIGKDQ